MISKTIQLSNGPSTRRAQAFMSTFTDTQAHKPCTRQGQNKEREEGQIGFPARSESKGVLTLIFPHCIRAYKTPPLSWLGVNSMDNLRWTFYSSKCPLLFESRLRMGLDKLVYRAHYDGLDNFIIQVMVFSLPFSEWLQDHKTRFPGQRISSYYILSREWISIQYKCADNFM